MPAISSAIADTIFFTAFDKFAAVNLSAITNTLVVGTWEIYVIRPGRLYKAASVSEGVVLPFSILTLAVPACKRAGNQDGDEDNERDVTHSCDLV